MQPSKAQVSTAGSPPDESLWAPLLECLGQGQPWQVCVSRYPQARCRPFLDTLYAHTLQLARTDLLQAERLSVAAIELAEELADPFGLGLACRTRANIQYLQGDYLLALENYQQAISHFQQSAHPSDRSVEIARTQNSAIQTLAYLGRYDEAISWAEHARAVFARQQDVARLARLDGNLANLYFRLDRFGEALSAYERARDAFRHVGSPQDIAAVLSNLATCYISVGRFSDALASHQEARRHCAAHGFSLLVAQADYNIAYLHLHRGDLHQAMRLYAEARDHCTKAGDFYHATLCDLDQAELMLEVNLLAEAERLARRAMQGFRKLEMRYERAKAAAFLATALARRQDNARAWRAFLRARRLFLAEGNQVWTAFIDLHLGLLNLQAGNVKSALSRTQKAVLVFEQRQIPGKSILAHLVLARVCIAAGDLPAAADACRAALRRADAIESPGLRFASHSLLGDVLQQQGAFNKARSAFQTASDLLDRLRAGVPGEELRIAFFEDKSSVYENLALLHLNAPGLPPNHDAAWGCIQSAKSRALLDSLGQVSVSARQAATDAALQDSGRNTLSGLCQQLHELYVSASHAELQGLPTQAARWRQKAQVLEQRLQQEHAQLRLLDNTGDPGAQDTATSTVPLAQLQQVLQQGEVFIEFFCAGNQVIAFVARPNHQPSVHMLGEAAPLRSLTRLALFQISSYHHRGSHHVSQKAQWPALSNHLSRLHQALLAPILDHIPETTHTLIFAPHGFLHSLPFAALGCVDSPLGTRFQIIRTLSASAYVSASFQHLRQIAHSQESVPHRPSVVMGVPDHRAPLIESEVHQIAALLPHAQLHLGSQATLDVLRNNGVNASVIHIASHGMFRSDNPMFSSIRMGDGNLNLYELQQMRLPAELVTLSGCSTGVHVVLGGDELIGLSRGFFQAGTRNVMVTLWDVNDASTARFMTLFYRAFLKHRVPGLALSSAIQQLREEYPHPYHWAAFSLMASSQPFPQEAVN
jgi:CHAT domain-containing protein